MKVHFIAIGGAAMHNLAIALHQKGYQITGSDDEILEPSRSRLAAYGLLPLETGWFPEKLSTEIDTVILGMHAKADNPELLEAKRLGLKICSFPEYLFQQTRDKIRVVIGGSHGKTTITSMILYVLKTIGLKFDYLVGAQLEGFDAMIGLSEDSRIAIFEGDEYLTSPIDTRPKFHLYQPHVAVITGIAWDHINAFPSFENYAEQFRIFSSLIERDGKLIYFQEDEYLQSIAENVREDITSIAYGTPEYEIMTDGTTVLNTKYGNFPLKVFGEHNMQNINAARLACRQIGVQDKDFYEIISGFEGTAKRLQKIASNGKSVIYWDFAHTPFKLKATLRALKQQYSDRELVACMELHTFSSLSSEFLPQYAGSMEDADIAFVFFDPEAIRRRKLNPITKEQVQDVFGNKVHVFTDNRILLDEIRKTDLTGRNLLLMTSGDFAGVNVTAFAEELLK